MASHQGNKHQISVSYRMGVFILDIWISGDLSGNILDLLDIGRYIGYRQRSQNDK